MLRYDRIPPDRCTIVDFTGRLSDEGHLGVLGIALAQWMARDDAKAQPEVRQAASTAMHAIDQMRNGGAAENSHADTVPSSVPTDAGSAALIALRATMAPRNGLTQNQLMNRFGLTRAAASRVRQAALAGADGSGPET